MGFHPVNKVKLERIADDRRVIIASAYDDVLAQWEEQEFPYEQLASAIDWIDRKMRSLDI